MKNPFPILFRIIKAPWITLKLDDFYYGVCTKPHPNLKVIPNKKYLVALMKNDLYYYVNQIPYEIRKSIRNGNTYILFSAVAMVRDIIEINNSIRERQGKPLPSYFTDIETYREYYYGKLLHGIFKAGKLIAYADIVKYGDVYVIGPFMGHADYLKEGIMYHLFDQIQKEHYPLMYDTFLGNTKGLTYFKKKLGFKEYNLRWVK